MKNYAYIFPNGDHFNCEGSKTQNHTETVKTFLKGLEIYDLCLYNKLIAIFNEYYNGCNYDDFAIFTLGWIKVTNFYKTTFCLADYDFQKTLLKMYYIPNCSLDFIPNFYKFPIIICNNLDYKKIILMGKLV